MYLQTQHMAHLALTSHITYVTIPRLAGESTEFSGARAHGPHASLTSKQMTVVGEHRSTCGAFAQGVTLSSVES